jgi:dihydrofolate synthase / folylpolyglutamate synthase
VTYDETIEWLLSFADFERSGRFQDRPDVAPMLALLERLGNPHLGRTTVHIAGSKGKGSVAAILSSILGNSTSEVGRYTSPHLYSYTERIWACCGGAISESGFAALVAERLKPAVDQHVASLGDRQLVTFDLLTALAFLAFRDIELSGFPHPIVDQDVQVIEVGLGGRVDSTNVFRAKEVAVITPISLEHTSILGDTVEQIAREKAAIITPGCVVVMAPQPYADADRVIHECVAAAEATLIDVRKEYRWRTRSREHHGQTISVEGSSDGITSELPLLGNHQVENAVTAIACVDALSMSDPEDVFEADTEAIAEGLASVRWPCRIEVVREDPLVVVDGAHNRDSARRLAETLVEYFACDRALFVIGCGSDKDIDGLAEELAPLAVRVIAVRAEHPRAMDPRRIAEAFGRLNVDAEIVDNVANGVDKALAATSDGAFTLICVAGSLFVAAEARAHVLGVRT